MVPLDPLPSVHEPVGRVLFAPVTVPQPSMSDISRLSSFGGRPSDISDLLALDGPVTVSRASPKRLFAGDEISLF